MNTKNDTDKIEIDKITADFFNLFTNLDNVYPNLESIRELFIEEGLIINNTAGEPQIYNLESFIKPRKEILTNGTLTNFQEKEISHNSKACLRPLPTPHTKLLIRPSLAQTGQLDVYHP